MVGNKLQVAAWVRLMVTGQSSFKASGNIGRNPMDQAQVYGFFATPQGDP